jgi:hypothetical protein
MLFYKMSVVFLHCKNSVYFFVFVRHLPHFVVFVTHFRISEMYVCVCVCVCGGVCFVGIKGHSFLGGTLKGFWGFLSDYQNFNYLTCVRLTYCCSFVTQLRQAIEQT